MAVEIIPTGAALGAEIRGVDLARPIDDETFAEIDNAYNEHGVIFFRDQRITLLLGTSPLADAFVIAYRIPSLFRRLVGEGSLTASFIPVFSRYLATEPRRAVWEFESDLGEDFMPKCRYYIR